MLRCGGARSNGGEWRGWNDVQVSRGLEEGGIRAVVAVAVAFEVRVVVVGQGARAEMRLVSSLPEA